MTDDKSKRVNPMSCAFCKHFGPAEYSEGSLLECAAWLCEKCGMVLETIDESGPDFDAILKDDKIDFSKE